MKRVGYIIRNSDYIDLLKNIKNENDMHNLLSTHFKSFFAHKMPKIEVTELPRSFLDEMIDEVETMCYLWHVMASYTEIKHKILNLEKWCVSWMLKYNKDEELDTKEQITMFFLKDQIVDFFIKLIKVIDDSKCDGLTSQEFRFTKALLHQFPDKNKSNIVKDVLRLVIDKKPGDENFSSLIVLAKSLEIYENLKQIFEEEHNIFIFDQLDNEEIFRTKCKGC